MVLTTTLVIMVNFDGVPEPEEPPSCPNLVAGRDFSPYARPRARSESLRTMGAFARTPHSPPHSFREDDVSRPRLSRQLSPRSDSSLRKMFRHSRSHSSPPAMFEEAQEDGADEGDDDLQRQDSTATGSSPRARMLSEGSLVADDDDTITGYDFDSPLSVDPRRTSIADTGPQRYLFGYALPLWCTTRPNASRVTTCIAKNAPCFWCSRERLNLTTTNQAILMRLASLCGFLGLCQAGSASYLLIVLISKSIVDRQAQYVDRFDEYKERVPSLWNVNTFVLAAGVLGFCLLVVMICARRVFRDLDLTGSLRFMWCMLWIIPLEVYCTIGMFGK